MTSMKAGDDAPCLLFGLSKSLLFGEEEEVERDAATATMITIIIETVIARTMSFLRRDNGEWGGSDSDGAS